MTLPSPLDSAFSCSQKSFASITSITTFVVLFDGSGSGLLGPVAVSTAVHRCGDRKFAISFPLIESIGNNQAASVLKRFAKQRRRGCNGSSRIGPLILESI